MLLAPAPRDAARRVWAMAFLAVLLAAPLLCFGADQAREVRLDKEFDAEKGDELPAWHIDDEAIRAEVEKLLEREKKLAQIEASVAADLSGRLDKMTAEDQASVWDNLWGYYHPVAAAVAKGSELAGAFVGFVVDGAPAVMNLYWFSARVSRAIDETVAKRHALENKYADKLLGVKPPAEKGKDKEGADAGQGEAVPTFFDSGAQDRILTTLRERMDAVRRLRQEKVDSFLLTRRAVDRSALPTATFERANDLWLGNASKIEKLESDLEAAKAHHRDLLAMRETRFALVKYAEKLIADCDKPKKEGEGGAGPADPERKKQLQAKLKRLKEQLEKAETGVKAQKQRMDDLSQAIEKEKLGYDSKTGKVREEPWTRQKLDELGAAISSGYAELAIRRRILNRVTREAEHLYGVAERLSAFRRMCLTEKQRRAIIETDDAFKGEALRGAYIDQGVASLCRRERRDEDTFMGQLDYSLRMISAAKKFGEGFIQKKVDDLNRLAEEFDNPAQTNAEMLKRKLADLRKDLRFFCDEVGQLKEVGGGAFTVFVEQAKSLLVVTGIYEARLEVEKVHEKVRDKRKETDDQIELIRDAMGVADARVPALFGLEATMEEPWEFDAWLNKPPGTRVLKLFHEDKNFFDSLDGGLRRIASAGITERVGRITAEYLIAYEKGCYTLRELKQTERDMLGLDPKTGEFSFKLFLSPVRSVVVAVRYICRGWLVGAELEIEEWVNQRTEQLDGMRQTFTLLKKAEFNWPKLEKISAKRKTFWHAELLREHPEYRRFWHRMNQENQNGMQAALMRRKRTADAQGSFFEKSAVNQRLELAGSSLPSPQFLAPAHYQDALDQIQLYNYPSALQSLILANELDPDVVSVKQIDDSEELFAWWDTGGKLGKLATEIGDQVVWYLITQGIMSKVVTPFREGLAGYLNVPLPPASPQSFATQFGNVLKGYVNPLRNIVSYETYAREGLGAALFRFAKESTYELVEDSFKEEVLLRTLKMDQAVADRLAGMLFSLTTEMLDTAGNIGSQHARMSLEEFKRTPLYKQLKKNPRTFFAELVLKYKEKFLIGVGLKKALTEPERLQQQVAQRTLLRQSKVDAIDAALKKIDEEVAQEKLKPEEADVRRKWLEATRRLATEDFTPEKLKQLVDELPVNWDNVKKMLDEAMPDAERQKVVDECAEFVRALHDNMDDLRAMLKLQDMEGGGSAGKKQYGEILKRLDAARQAVHRESFNEMARLLKNGTDDEIKTVLEKAGIKIDGTIVTIQKVRELLSKISVIVPTGSAGSIHRLMGEGEFGEYKPYESDMDFTVLLKSGQKIPSELRIALEKILGASLAKVGKDPKIAKKFDVAFMSDDFGKFTGSSRDRWGPQEVADEIQRIKDLPPEQRQQEMQKLWAELDEALATTRADLAHPERYRTAGRLQLLWYLTALGDHFLTFENGQFVKKMKKDVDKFNDALKEFAIAGNAKLKKWMSWEIIFDDLYFAGKKATGVAETDVLDKQAYAAVMKEIGKRNIRELIGAMVTDDVLLGKINKLLEAPFKGEYVDHKAICDLIAAEVKARGQDTNPPLKDLVELITLMGEYKNNPDVDALIRKRGGDPSKPETYCKELQKIMQLQENMANRCADSANAGLKEHMGPFFQGRDKAAQEVDSLIKEVEAARQKVKDCQDEGQKAALQAKLRGAVEKLKFAWLSLESQDIYIRNKLLTALAGFNYLGGHLRADERPMAYNKMQQQLMETLKATGASKADVEAIFAEIGIKDGFRRLIDTVYGVDATSTTLRTLRRRLDEERQRQVGEGLRTNQENYGKWREGDDAAPAPPEPKPEPPPPKKSSAVPAWWRGADTLPIRHPGAARIPAPARIAA